MTVEDNDSWNLGLGPSVEFFLLPRTLLLCISRKYDLPLWNYLFERFYASVLKDMSPKGFS